MRVPVPRLEYAQPPPARRRLVRRLLTAFVCLSALSASWKLAGPCYEHGRYLYWQRRCMTYTLPADTVIASNDPAECDRLLLDPRKYASPSVSLPADPTSPTTTGLFRIAYRLPPAEMT